MRILRGLVALLLLVVLPVAPALPMLVAPIAAVRILASGHLTFGWGVLNVLLMCLGCTVVGLLMGLAAKATITLLPDSTTAPVTKVVQYLTYMVVLSPCYGLVVRPFGDQILAAAIAITLMEVGDRVVFRRIDRDRHPGAPTPAGG